MFIIKGQGCSHRFIIRVNKKKICESQNKCLKKKPHNDALLFFLVLQKDSIFITENNLLFRKLRLFNV